MGDTSEPVFGAARPGLRPTSSRARSWWQRVRQWVAGDLDRHVVGTTGEARGTFAIPDDGRPVMLDVHLPSGERGSISVLVRSRPDEHGARNEQRRMGEAPMNLALGQGEVLRDAQVEIRADVNAAPSGERHELAALVVELEQPDDLPGAPPRAREVHSVESRFDEGGHATLSMLIDLR